MRFPTEYYQMKQTIQYYMPHLRGSQLKGLVLWVYGIIMAQSGCQNAVAAELSFIGNFNSIRQYLREGCTMGRTAPTRAECSWMSDCASFHCCDGFSIGGSLTDWCLP